MNLVFKTVFFTSLSGALLIMLLLFGGRFFGKRLGRQWQYYIWLIVVARLLLPFGPETSLMGRVYQEADGARTRMAQETHLAVRDSGQDFVQESGQSVETGNGFPLSEEMAMVSEYGWVVWLTVALAILIRKISMYQGYIKYVKTGAKTICDLALLDQLAVAADKLGVSRTVELCVNPLVASPMLVGYFHPCIILPRADVSEREFCWIAMHELTHYKQRDILYKWLVQFVVCLHWFNPFVHFMSREIDRTCEFACDEAVVAKMGYDYAADYGKTLLNAMAAYSTYREPPAAVTMSTDKELLKERLGAIMSCKKKTKITGILAVGLTMCIALGAFFLGIYPAVAEKTVDTGEEEVFSQKMVVAMHVCKIREGAGVGYQVVGLVGEGEIVTVLGKEEGNDGQMWYLLDRESLAEPPDESVKACYIRADLLQKE